jgi:hypothetical protein
MTAMTEPPYPSEDPWVVTRSNAWPPPGTNPTRNDSGRVFTTRRLAVFTAAVLAAGIALGAAIILLAT